MLKRIEFVFETVSPVFVVRTSCLRVYTTLTLTVWKQSWRTRRSGTGNISSPSAVRGNCRSWSVAERATTTCDHVACLSSSRRHRCSVHRTRTASASRAPSASKSPPRWKPLATAMVVADDGSVMEHWTKEKRLQGSPTAEWRHGGISHFVSYFDHTWP